MAGVLNQLIRLLGGDQVRAELSAIEREGKKAFASVKKGVDEANESLAKTAPAAEEAGQSVLVTGRFATMAATAIGGLAYGLYRLAQSYAEAAAATARFVNEQARAAQSAGISTKNYSENIGALQQLGATAAEAEQGVKNFGAGADKAFTEGITKLKQLGITFAETAAGRKAAWEMISRTTANEAARTGDALARVTAAVKAAKGEFDPLTGTLKQSGEAWANVAGELEKIKDPLTRLQVITKELAGGNLELGRRLAESLKGGKQAFLDELEDYRRLSGNKTDEMIKKSEADAAAYARSVLRYGTAWQELNRSDYFTPWLTRQNNALAEMTVVLNQELTKWGKAWSEWWAEFGKPLPPRPDPPPLLSPEFLQAWDDTLTWMGDVWDRFKEKVGVAWADLGVLFEPLVTAFNTAIDTMVAKAVQGWEIIKGLFSSPVQGGSTGAPSPTPEPFAAGGYTGDGGRLQPAGIVHRGEYVQPQHVVRQPGVLPFMETLRRSGGDLHAVLSRFRGFDMGGLVDTMGRSLSGRLLPGFAEGGMVAGGGLHPVVIQLPSGRGVAGFTGTPSAIAEFTKYARRESLTSAGGKPSWVGG